MLPSKAKAPLSLPTQPALFPLSLAPVGSHRPPLQPAAGSDVLFRSWAVHGKAMIAPRGRAAGLLTVRPGSPGGPGVPCKKSTGTSGTVLPRVLFLGTRCQSHQKCGFLQKGRAHCGPVDTSGSCVPSNSICSDTVPRDCTSGPASPGGPRCPGSPPGPGSPWGRSKEGSNISWALLVMQPPVFRDPPDPLVNPSPAKHSHQPATAELGDSTHGRGVGGGH